jgi:hypothetical protein
VAGLMDEIMWGLPGEWIHCRRVHGILLKQNTKSNGFFVHSAHSENTIHGIMLSLGGIMRT